MPAVDPNTIYSALVIPGLHARFATLAGLTVLDYEPTAIQAYPTLYSLLDSMSRDEKGQILALRYRTLHRLCIQWQEFEQAEIQIRPWIDAIPNVIAADPQLGSRIKADPVTRILGGMAEINSATAGFAVIGGTMTRIIDFYSDVLVKIDRLLVRSP